MDHPVLRPSEPGHPTLSFFSPAMPDMNGFRIIESLRSLGLRSTLFVVLADYSSEYYERECRDAGFHYYELDAQHPRNLIGQRIRP